MGSILTCDTSGTNSLFKITGYKVNLAKPQTGATCILNLPQSGYKENFVLETVDENGARVELINGDSNDYFFSVTDRDILGEGIIGNAHAGFNKQLYKSVRVREAAFRGKPRADFYITYQSVFPNILISAIDQSGNPNAGPLCTPELLNSIVTDLALLKGQMSGDDVVYSTAKSLPSPLAMDLTGENPDNEIVNEDHNVNNTNGKVIIRPANGSFYGHDVVVKDSAGVPLVYGEDYQIQALDVEATKICEHESGVWRYIVITKPYTGNLSISYRAFGGEVSVRNFKSMRDQVQALKDYINKGAFLTVNTVGAAPLINEMIARLDTLDRYYLSLEMSGFREMSYRFNAKKDSNGNEHWYSIAYLYRQRDNSTDPKDLKVYTNDSVRLKIRIDELNTVMDLYIYGNVKSSTLRIKSMEADIGDGYAAPNDYNVLRPLVLPEFRLLWRTDNNYQYGAVLQMRINIPSDTDHVTVLVENHNKAGLGGWILCNNANGTGDVNPEDETALLPGNAQWVGGTNYNAGIAAMPEYSNGKILWAGSFGLHEADAEFNGHSGYTTLNPISTARFDCKSINNITFCIFDRFYDHYIYKTVSVKTISSISLNAYCIIDELDNDFILINIRTSADETAMVYSLRTIMGTKSRLLHRFDLRQISINSPGE